MSADKSTDNLKRPRSPGDATEVDVSAAKAKKQRKLDTFALQYDLTTLSDEQVLGEFIYSSRSRLAHPRTAEQMKHWSSPVYDDYKLPPTIFSEYDSDLKKKIVKYRFVCAT